MEFNAAEIIRNIAIFFPIFLFSLSFHEFAHGWMAHKKGDNTAEMMGRLNMNPWTHADPIGTILLPIVGIASSFMMFGWGKPVPVNSRNLANPRVDMFWIALAGPLSNIILYIFGALIYLVYVLTNPNESLTAALTLKGLSMGTLPVALEIAIKFLGLNLVLALFNLIPVHPLDGGKILARFLPEEVNRFLEEQQMFLFVALMLFFFAGFNFLAQPIWSILITTMFSIDQIAFAVGS